MIGEGRTGKIEGILRDVPGRDGRLSHAIPVVRRVVDRKRNICRRSVFRRNGLHHVLLSEPFRGGLIVSHRNLVEFTVVEGEKDLFYGIRLVRSPGEVWRPPIYFLNQRWTAMNQLHIGHLLAGALQHFGQAHSERKVPILGKILRTKQWRRKKQDNKKKNRTAYRFHFRISYELLRTWNQGRISPCGHFCVWGANRHSQARVICRDQANTLLAMAQMRGNTYESNLE